MPKKIMVADDEPVITSTFKIGLERNGFQVGAYNNSQQALSEFRPGKYDLLLLDISMPGMSGFELYHEIRNVDAGVKACFLTAFGTYRRELTPALDEVKCFVKKPVTL
ncbi:MAG TPA: response regulator [Nitrososphaera sp.]|nr:response regulator [Nitrososphaera sp.]